MYVQFTTCVYGDHNIKENEIKLSNISRAKSSAAFWRKKNHFKSFGISRYYTEQKKMKKASPHGNVNCNLFRCKGGTTVKIAELSKMNRKINDICIRENPASCCLPFIAKGCPGVEVGHGREGMSFKTIPFQFLSYCVFDVDWYDFQFFLLYFLFFQFLNFKSMSVLRKILIMWLWPKYNNRYEITEVFMLHPSYYSVACANTIRRKTFLAS